MKDFWHVEFSKLITVGEEALLFLCIANTTITACGLQIHKILISSSLTSVTFFLDIPQICSREAVQI